MAVKTKKLVARLKALREKHADLQTQIDVAQRGCCAAAHDEVRRLKQLKCRCKTLIARIETQLAPSVSKPQTAEEVLPEYAAEATPQPLEQFPEKIVADLEVAA